MKIPTTFFQSLLFLFISLAFTQCNFSNAKNQSQPVMKGEYSCMPCGQDCDKKVFKEPGNCPDCHMNLVKRSTISFKTIQPSAICQYIKAHPGVVLLDVRTKEEFEGKADPNFGTLTGAINVPIQELESKIAILEPYKEKEIIVFCSHSHRSPRASYILMQHGFTNVTNMAGGMSVMKDGTCKK